MKINQITLNPQKTPAGTALLFRVGEVAVDGGQVIEKITFHPDNNLFNKGREVSAGCYSVFFEETPERNLIMASGVASIEVVTEKKNIVPELPE